MNAPHPTHPGGTAPSLPTSMGPDPTQVAATARRFEQFVEPTPDAHQGVPPCERPARRRALRRVVVGLGVVVTLTAMWIYDIANVGPGENTASPSALRAAALVFVVLYLCGLGLFAFWHQLIRHTLHDLTGRGPIGRSWAAAWVLVPVVAAPIAYMALDRDAHVGLVVLGCAVVAFIRISMLREMASNVARVTQLPNARAGLWGLVLAWADVMAIGVAIYGFSEPDAEGSQLATASLNLIYAVAIGTLFLYVFTKRTERGLMEFWDTRYANLTAGVSELLAKIGRESEAIPVNTRRLIPLAPVRYLLIASYWAVAAASIWDGAVVWSLRDELTFSSDPESTVDQLNRSILIFVATLLVMQFIQGLWSVGVAWNAQRCTLRAPSPLGMAILFSLGPLGMLIAASTGAIPMIIGLVVLLNLVCWGFSFGLLSRTIESLGRPSTAIKAWGWAVSLHWLLGYSSWPLALLDDLNYSYAVVALSLLDAGIFIFASIVAWKAMIEFEAATRDHEQVRRIRRKRWQRSAIPGRASS